MARKLSSRNFTAFCLWGALPLMMVLSLLFCTIQVVVFTMLTSIYPEEVTAHDIEVR